MNVDIICFATLSNGSTCRFDQSRTVSIDNESPTARSLAHASQIPESEIATILVNGKRAAIDHRLNEGDRVAFVPAVGGM